ncbi:hypothetical protein BH11MYX2_BH11MYX2_02890 [soil metagenome]
MVRVSLVIVALSAGCFSTPTFRGGSGSGSDAGNGDASCVDSSAYDATARMDAPITCTWGIPVVLPGAFFGDVTGQPTTNAAMTLMMWDYGPGGTTNDLHYATRAPADDTWTVYDDEPFDTGNNTQDLDPTLNDAGDVLFFLSNASGASTLYETRHTCSGWGTPQPVQSEAGINDVVAIDTVGDGNTLYIAFGGKDMRVLTRPDRDTAFARSVVVDTHALFPGISPDQRSVYDARFDGLGLDHYTRSSLTSSFSSTPTEHLFGSMVVSDAEILDDGVHMIVAMDRVTAAMSTCQ